MIRYGELTWLEMPLDIKRLTEKDEYLVGTRWGKNDDHLAWVLGEWWAACDCFWDGDQMHYINEQDVVCCAVLPAELSDLKEGKGAPDCMKPTNGETT